MAHKECLPRPFGVTAARRLGHLQARHRCALAFGPLLAAHGELADRDLQRDPRARPRRRGARLRRRSHRDRIVARRACACSRALARARAHPPRLTRPSRLSAPRRGWRATVQVYLALSCLDPLPALVIVDEFTAADDQATHAFMATGTTLEVGPAVPSRRPLPRWFGPRPSHRRAAGASLKQAARGASLLSPPRLPLVESRLRRPPTAANGRRSSMKRLAALRRIHAHIDGPLGRDVRRDGLQRRREHEWA